MGTPDPCKSLPLVFLGNRAHHRHCTATNSGLFSFASSALIRSLYNVGARGITTPNVVVGMAALFCGGLALFYGGLAQLLAGRWEFVTGDAIAIYLTTWGVSTFLLYVLFKFCSLGGPRSPIFSHCSLATLRKSIGLPVLFFCLSVLSFFLTLTRTDDNGVALSPKCQYR